MVEASHPSAHGNRPRHAMVERTHAEQRREAEGIDGCGERGPRARGREDERGAGDQRDEERILVRHAAKSRLDGVSLHGTGVRGGRLRHD